MYLENNEVRKYPLSAIVAWTLVVLWMSVIFLFSHQDSDTSGSLSSSLATIVLNFLKQPADGELAGRMDALLRTLAHGFIFFILGWLVSRAFARIEINDIRNAILSLIVSLLYAVSDELHQAFIPGRASQLSDFFVDGAGILLAVLLYQVITTIRFLRAELQVERDEDLRL